MSCTRGGSDGFGIKHVPGHLYPEAIAEWEVQSNWGNDFEIVRRAWNKVDPTKLELVAPVGLYLGQPRENGPRLNNTSHFGSSVIKGWSNSGSGESASWDSADGLMGVGVSEDWDWTIQQGTTWIGKLAGISTSQDGYLLDNANGSVGNVGFSLRWDRKDRPGGYVGQGGDLTYSINNGTGITSVVLHDIGWGWPSDSYVIEFGYDATECWLIAYGRDWTRCEPTGYQYWKATGAGLPAAAVGSPYSTLHIGRPADGAKEGVGHYLSGWTAFDSKIEDDPTKVYQDEDYLRHSRVVQSKLVRR